jgi:hypothetical protein
MIDWNKYNECSNWNNYDECIKTVHLLKKLKFF